MKSDSSNSIYYLLIVFFIIMIFIPPILRIALPNDEISNNENNNFNNNVNSSLNNNSNNQNISKKLNCEINQTLANNTIKLNVLTDYYDNRTTSIIFTYDLSGITNIELLSGFSIFDEINELKQLQGVQYTKNGTQEVISLDSTVIVSNESNLKSFTNNVELQKTYYEQFGLSCTVN